MIEARGNNQRVSVVVTSECDPTSQKKEVDAVLGVATALMHGVATKERTDSGKLGPVLSADVLLEGESVSALVDTRSPITIVSLSCLVKILAKKQQQDQSPAQWRSVEKRVMPPDMYLFCNGGGELNLVKRMEVTVSRAGCSISAVEWCPS